jgi:hypothetical protein
LRQEALLSYADAVPVVGAGGQSPGDLVEVTDQTTYLALTVGDISGTLKLLQAQQSQLAGTLAASRRELASALEAESSAGAARQLALREAGSLQVLLSKAQSQVAALTAAERPRTGPPVGDGIVKAVAQQLGAAPATAVPKGIGGRSARAAGAAVTALKPATVFKAGPHSCPSPHGGPSPVGCRAVQGPGDAGYDNAGPGHDQRPPHDNDSPARDRDHWVVHDDHRHKPHDNDDDTGNRGQCGLGGAHCIAVFYDDFLSEPITVLNRTVLNGTVHNRTVYDDHYRPPAASHHEASHPPTAHHATCHNQCHNSRRAPTAGRRPLARTARL